MSATGKNAGLFEEDWRDCDYSQEYMGIGSCSAFHFLSSMMEMAPCFPPRLTSVEVPLHVRPTSDSKC